MDEIQRKLALMDGQLAGRRLHRRLVSTAPLFLPAIGLMVGILLQDRVGNALMGPAVSTSLGTWLTLLSFGVAAAWIYFVRNRHSPRPEILAYGALFCFTCLGAVRLLVFEKAGPRDIRNIVGSERVLATIRGRILTRPYQERQDWCFAQSVSADPSSAFYLRLDGLQTPTGWQQVTGTVRVQVDEPTPNLRVGDRVRAYCWLHRFEEPSNPGQFNFAEYLRIRNIYVGASVPTRDAIGICTDRSPDIWIGLRSTFTGAAAQGLLDHPPVDTQGEAMIEALLLGERRNIDRDTNEAFRRTGLLHLISLSGMHLSILIGIVWWSCKPAGFSKRTRAMICILATAVFLLIVPPLGPILRAAVIVWAYCASILLRRRANAVNSLSLAVIVLLLFRPTQLFEAGWQLSFASVAGILAFTRKIEDLAHAGARHWFRPANREAGAAMRLLRNTGAVVIRVLSVGVSAWLGSAGILLYHFYNITPLASLWTAIASPWVTAILVLGFLKILLSFFLPTLSLLLSYPLRLLADLLIWLVKLMAGIDFSYILIGHVPLVLIVLYYVLILFAAFVYLRRPVVKKGLCTAMALTLVLSLGVMKWQRTHRDHLSLTCLNVGHGQALLAQLPGTMNILFDAGSLYGRDVGSRIVVPFLDYIGIGRLHAIVVSHHDLDHINGIPEVVDRRRVDCVYIDDTSFPQTQSVETAGLLMRHLENKRIRVQYVDRITDTVAAHVHALWPAGEPMMQGQLGENDKSLVCVIEFAGKSVLLCSDIEEPAQRETLRLYPALKADVVVVPHHGSVRTLDNGFLKQLESGILLCSCGRQDYERGRVLRQADDAKMLLTATDGAVTICIEKAGVVKTTTLGLQHGD